MKIELERNHAVELFKQISGIREMYEKMHGTTKEWDATPLGKFFSLLKQETATRANKRIAGRQAKHKQTVRSARKRFSGGEP
jgi:hypothetical protein